MPKTHKRRKTPTKTSSGQSRAAVTQTRTSNGSMVKITPVGPEALSKGNTAIRNQSFFSPRVAGPQSLIFPGMVAAGCWLMAYTLIFLTNDDTRYILGGMAVLMALLWTFSLIVRVRKLMLIRQRQRS